MCLYNFLESQAPCNNQAFIIIPIIWDMTLCILKQGTLTLLRCFLPPCLWQSPLFDLSSTIHTTLRWKCQASLALYSIDALELNLTKCLPFHYCNVKQRHDQSFFHIPYILLPGDSEPYPSSTPMAPNHP